MNLQTISAITAENCGETEYFFGGIIMTIPNSNFHFFHDGKSLFVSVKIPKGLTVYMNTNGDNRPYTSIVSDIQDAIDILDAECPKGYTHLVDISYNLPKLLGYRRVSASLK